MKIITIGRSSQNDIVIGDEKVSRRHLQIIQDDYGNFSLADFGSTNGTIVNGRKITGEVSLSPNDVIEIGNTTLPWQNYFPTARTQVIPTDGVMPTEAADYIPPTDIYETNEDKQRHGFITFWLWLGIIGNIFGIIGVIATYVMFENQMSAFRYQDGFEQIKSAVDSISSSLLTTVICTIMSAIAGIILISFILKWRKIGFYGLVVSSVIFGSINLFVTTQLGKAFQEMGAYYDTTQQMLISVVSILFGTFIMWAVLQIKKNGVKCWDLLE